MLSAPNLSATDCMPVAMPAKSDDRPATPFPQKLKVESFNTNIFTPVLAIIDTAAAVDIPKLLNIVVKRTSNFLLGTGGRTITKPFRR